MSDVVTTNSSKLEVGILCLRMGINERKSLFL